MLYHHQKDKIRVLLVQIVQEYITIIYKQRVSLVLIVQ